MSIKETVIDLINSGYTMVDVAHHLRDVKGDIRSVRTLRRLAANIRSEYKSEEDSYRDSQQKIMAYKPTKVINEGDERVLVIGDLHAPFILDGYLEFCYDMFNKYDCNRVVFMGDLIDNHYSSYHETDPDGFGGGEELERAIHQLKRWVHTFPVADICIGNHDRLILRKAFSSGIPRAWVKDFSDILGAPDWNFGEQFIYNHVRYIHGDGGVGTALTAYKRDMISTVTGHFHTKSGIEFHVGTHIALWGMQIGAGMNDKSYAAAYARGSKKSIINCGIVLDNGKLPIIEMMDLGNKVYDC